jgi:hypothetical protein
MRAIAPSDSTRATAFTAAGQVSQYVVGNGSPWASIVATQLIGHRHDVGRAQRALGGGQRCLHEPMVAEATRTGR